MAPLLKQSGESAIASRDKVFFSARIKLTGMYVLLLALILFGFSGTLYQSLARNLQDAGEESFAGPDVHHHFVESTLAEVQNEILLIDVTILLGAAMLSYVLAGYTLKPIQYSMEAQKKFSENASHELRTPLAVMKSEAEVLLRNPNPTKELVRAMLISSVEEIDRMTTMTEDLLFLARSENGAHSLREKIDISELAKKSVEKIQSIAEGKGIRCIVSAGMPLFVEGNKAAGERILMNVLQNAVRYTPRNGTVSVTVEKEGSRAVLTIADTGSGIEEKDLPHIFERFYKGEMAQGTGLGLSIVKELVEQYNGTVSVASIQGEGTTVVIKFPVVAG